MEVRRVVNDAHSMQITCCAYNRERQELYSGGQDTLVKAWDVNSGRLRFSLSGHKGWVTDVMHVSLSPSLGLLFSSSIDGSVIVWNTSDRGKIMQRVDTAGPCFCLGYERKRRLVVAGGEKTVGFYKLTSSTGGSGSSTGQNASPVGPIGNGSRLHAQDMKKGGAGATSAVGGSIAQAPKLLRLVSAFKSHADLVRGVACSDSGKIYTVGYDRRICRYDSENPRETCQEFQRCHEGAICSVALNHVNSWVITGSYDGTVKIWSQDMRCLEVFDSVGDTVTGLCHVPATKAYWITGRGRRLLAIDAKSPADVTDVVTETSGFDRFSVQKLVQARGTDMVIGITTTRQLVVWDYNPCAAWRVLRAHHDWVEALCCVSSGTAAGNIFTSGADGLLLRWQQSTSLREDSYACSDQMHGHHGPVLCIVHCADLDILITGSEDATIRVWHVHDHSTTASASSQAEMGVDQEKLHEYNVLKGHESRVSAICVCRDQVLASVSHDLSLRFWDLHTKSELSAVHRAHDAPILCADYCAANDEVATCAAEVTVKIWNAHRHSLKYVLTLDVEASFVTWCKFASCWVTAEENGLVKFWTAAGGSSRTGGGECRRLDAVMHVPGECATSLCIDEDNQLILAAMQDHSLRAFRIEPSMREHVTAATTTAATSAPGKSKATDFTMLRKQQQALLYLGHTDLIRGVVYVPSKGHYLTVSWDKTMRAWLAPLPDGSSDRSIETMMARQRRLRQSSLRLSGPSATSPSESMGDKLHDDDDENFISSYERANPLVMPRALKQQTVKRGSIVTVRLPTGVSFATSDDSQATAGAAAAGGDAIELLAR